MSTTEPPERPGMGEQLFVGCSLLALFVLPPVMVEAFPLTAAPMFSVKMPRWLLYTLFDRHGRVLDNDVYGLRTSPLWNMEGSFGPQFPENVVTTSDSPADMEAVLRHVREVGRRDGVDFPLRLRCVIKGAIDHRTVGVVATKEWTVTRDKGRPAAK